MDDIILLLAGSCAVLALLVYLMYRSATSSEWQALTHTEKTRWRNEEEEKKEQAAANQAQRTTTTEGAAKIEMTAPSETTAPTAGASPRSAPLAKAKRRKVLPNNAS